MAAVEQQKIGPVRPERFLAPAELAEIAAAVPSTIDIDAMALIRPEQRTFQLLWRDAHSEAWLLCWSQDHDTGWHDHDTSSAGVHVHRGQLLEELPVIGGEPVSRVYSAGETFCFDETHIHRMRDVVDAAAISVHVYSPPLARMGQYEIGDDGRLTRRWIPGDEELKHNR